MATKKKLVGIQSVAAGGNTSYDAINTTRPNSHNLVGVNSKKVRNLVSVNYIKVRQARSAISGRITSIAYAIKHPQTTVIETRKIIKRKIGS